MVLGIGTFLSDFFIVGGKAPVFGSPNDFKLDFEQVEFQRTDGVTLRGWLINPAANNNKKVIIQTHFGVQSCRSGYTPEGKGMFPISKDPIEFLKAVPHYVEQGYSVLMYDMSNHGDSDKGTCPYVSWGPHEANDVLAAVESCSSKRGFEQIYLLSICMGGVASTHAYGMLENGLSTNTKIKSMIIIQPTSYSEIIKNMGVPSMLSNMSSPVNNERLGLNLDETSCVSDADKITVPTMVIQNNNDPWHDRDWIQSFYDKLTVAEKEMVWLDLEKTRFAAYEWITQHPEELTAWFNKY